MALHCTKAKRGARQRQCGSWSSGHEPSTVKQSFRRVDQGMPGSTCFAFHQGMPGTDHTTNLCVARGVASPQGSGRSVSKLMPITEVMAGRGE